MPTLWAQCLNCPHNSRHWTGECWCVWERECVWAASWVELRTGDVLSCRLVGCWGHWMKTCWWKACIRWLSSLQKKNVDPKSNWGVPLKRRASSTPPISLSLLTVLLYMASNYSMCAVRRWWWHQNAAFVDEETAFACQLIWVSLCTNRNGCRCARHRYQH